MLPLSYTDRKVWGQKVGNLNEMLHTHGLDGTSGEYGHPIRFHDLFNYSNEHIPIELTQRE